MVSMHLIFLFELALVNFDQIRIGMANLNQLARIAGIEALENAELLNENRRRFRVYDDAWEETEKGFVKLYRLSKTSASDLINLLTPHMIHPSRLSALSIERKVSTEFGIFVYSIPLIIMYDLSGIDST